MFRATRINKASSKPQSNTNDLKWVLFFIVEYESCFVCLSPPFLLLIFLFFAFFTYAYTNLTCFVKLSSLSVFKSPVSSPYDILIVDGVSNGKVRDVMAAYLLYKCKHLCMLKFRVVSPPLTKKVYILRIAGYNSYYIIWSQWCEERFIVHFTFL